MTLTFLETRAHGSVVKGIRPVNQRFLVQTLLWSMDVLCCALRQGTLSKCTLSESTQLKLGASLQWELTCNGLMSIHLAPHILWISTSPMSLYDSEKDLTFNLQYQHFWKQDMLININAHEPRYGMPNSQK